MFVSLHPAFFNLFFSFGPFSEMHIIYINILQLSHCFCIIHLRCCHNVLCLALTSCVFNTHILTLTVFIIHILALISWQIQTLSAWNIYRCELPEVVLEYFSFCYFNSNWLWKLCRSVNASFLWKWFISKELSYVYLHAFSMTFKKKKS